MMRKTECVAMLLAGGQGSRLGVLTKNVAKPAVPYGGKYRIIDFPLSNCTNSGIDTVGVLTQYQPLVLNDYIGSGQPWDLDRMYGGVHILPPYMRTKGSHWYKGTANAIYQNMEFIKRYAPAYVLILSGDHIYKMNYSKMIDFHRENNSDCTIAVLEVPKEEASRFGIMNTHEDGAIYEFEEKPKHPKSTKASMGIYVFSLDKLTYYLEQDEKDEKSSNDFGKDIIPAMLRDNQKLMAYPFEGYWKDVGTVESLWEANLDLLDPKVKMHLSDAFWKIYSRSPSAAAHYIHKDAKVQNSLISEGCYVAGMIDFSILFAGVTIEPGAVVRDSIVMPGARVCRDAVVQYSIVGENALIEKGAAVGQRPEEMEELDHWGVAVIGEDVTVGENSVVPPKAMVESNWHGGGANARK